jgi:TATA-box binding protein (TBP) (component of TFIID and TFIIIB)
MYLIFNSGKIVLPGVKSMEDLEKAVEEITDLINIFE